ncbi:MAG: PQQ-dependent sugar dehydrogenase [Thermoplasmata archaeon]
MRVRIVVLAVAFTAIVTVGVVFVLLGIPPFFEFPSGNLALETVHVGLNTPVAFAFAPDGRVFYNELQNGGVRVIRDGAVLPEPFVALNVVGQSEMGLLGLALDPDFATEPFVYVFYTYRDVDGTFNRISRFPALGDVAGTEEILLNRLPANAFHNGGRLGFGPDGLLYASLGDTGNAAHSQDPQTLPGKILRMHRDGALPGDNPFPASYTYLYGIRNVFGFDFSPAGALYFTENGPFGNDEVNLGLRGENYGWPVVQGADPDSRFIPPLVVFSPAIAPTGVGFYSGDRLGPSHTQVPYFGSFNFGRLYRLVEDAGNDSGYRSELVLDPPGLGGLLDVVDGPDGYLYVSFPDRIARVILEPTGPMTVPHHSHHVAVAEAWFVPSA